MYTASSRLDDVEFLIRSTNRLDVLDAVRHAPRSRHELREETDFSRVTLSRILGDLTERRWIDRENGSYAATTEGTIVAEEVGRLFANLEAVDSLGRTLSWLPVDRFDFELSRLVDAEVMLPDGHDLTGQIRWVGNHIRQRPQLRSVATWVAEEILETIVELTHVEGCSFEGVVEGDVIDHVSTDPALRAHLRSLLESDRARLYRYDGDEAALTMTVLPDGVLMCGQQNAWSFPEAVATEDAAVVSWATAHFEALRAESTPLTPDAFSRC